MKIKIYPRRKAKTDSQKVDSKKIVENSNSIRPGKLQT
jgi:hypothetical protein